MAMKLTENFTLEEMVQSATADAHKIDNNADEATINNLRELCRKVLQPLRNAYGKPITVSSGFRCAKLNALVGGTASSQHKYGYAADIKTKTKTDNKLLFKLAQELKLPFDQLIDESGYSWIHISYSPRHRRQVLHIK